MAKVAGYLGSSFSRFGRQFVLAVGGSVGIYSQTISADATFDETSAMVALIDGGVANRNVTALASCEVVGMVKAFYNAGSTNNLVIKNVATTTLATLKPGDWVILFHNGTAWTALNTVAATNALAAILATANTWTAAQTFNAAITTNGGISGSTARKIGGFVHIKQSTTTVSNTTTETDLGTHTLEANVIGLGTEVEIVGTARVTGVTGSPTLNLKLYCGSTVLDQTTAVTVASGDYYSFAFRLTGQAAASAASAVASNGTVLTKIAGVKGTNVVTGSPTNMATNGTLTCKLTATWGTASASNIVACDDFAVRVTG